jgi:hypothetical protein
MPGNVLDAFDIPVYVYSEHIASLVERQWICNGEARLGNGSMRFAIQRQSYGRRTRRSEDTALT